MAMTSKEWYQWIKKKSQSDQQRIKDSWDASNTKGESAEEKQWYNETGRKNPQPTRPTQKQPVRKQAYTYVKKEKKKSGFFDGFASSLGSGIKDMMQNAASHAGKNTFSGGGSNSITGSMYGHSSGGPSGLGFNPITGESYGHLSPRRKKHKKVAKHRKSGMSGRSFTIKFN